MTTIPLLKDASIIVLNVFVKHKERQKKIRMALDTGATYTIIPQEVAETLKLIPELTKKEKEIITASGTEKVPLVHLPIVRVGNAEAQQVKAIIHDLPSKSHVDGLLGLSFLKYFNVHLNFKEGNLKIN